MIGGSAGLVGHIELGDDVMITGLTMVTHSLKEPGVYSSGLPAIPAAQWRKAVARLHRLQRLERRIATLEGHKPGVETDTETNKEES
jgi:UDP-3-O-[3-hydroxymyristoyl] glucosamine N-acyltransferase